MGRERGLHFLIKDALRVISDDYHGRAGLMNAKGFFFFSFFHSSLKFRPLIDTTLMLLLAVFIYMSQILIY